MIITFLLTSFAYSLVPFPSTIRYQKYNAPLSLSDCSPISPYNTLNRCWKHFANPSRKGGDVPSDDPSENTSSSREIGVNWIEKSSPSGIGKFFETEAAKSKRDTFKSPDGYYDLGIDGLSFSVGPLSERMYDALHTVALRRFPPGTDSLPPELEKIYRVYTMDITAKEAVKAALNQNGLELALDQEDDASQDSGLWGEIDSVQLLDSLHPSEKIVASFDSLEEAVELGLWHPGQDFHFVVRNVPGRFKQMEISDLLKALDPDGKYRSEAKERGIVMPDEDISTLKDLGNDNERRANVAPRETESEKTVFRGDDHSMGYNIMLRRNLLREMTNMDGSENRATLLHVMDSFANHGCLIVDITNGGTTYESAVKIAKMWKTIDSFFEKLENDENIRNTLPPLSVAEGAGSRHALAGFASYEEGNMKFLETRLKRSSNGERIIPEVMEDIIGTEGVKSLTDAFRVMCDVGKDCVRIAIAAANMEAEAFVKQSEFTKNSLPILEDGEDNDDEESDDEDDVDYEMSEISDEKFQGEIRRLANIDASESASRLCQDLIDDGLLIVPNDREESVSMSPHRICSYSDKQSKTGMSETFGSHTDTSFVTIVPVAKVSGLEIFDEAANRWFRPELRARDVWESERNKQNQVINDRNVDHETCRIPNDGVEKEFTIPWHSRYLVVLPGELLQLCTRSEVPASVHRVVTVTNGAKRFSAPVLLRARPGMRMDVSKYFGSLQKAGPLLTESNGMKMEEIHDALQPSSFR